MFIVMYELRDDPDPEILKEAGSALQFAALVMAQDCADDLVKEIKAGQGGWVQLLLDDEVDLGQVVAVWVAHCIDVEGSRREV